MGEGQVGGGDMAMCRQVGLAAAAVEAGARGRAAGSLVPSTCRFNVTRDTTTGVGQQHGGTNYVASMLAFYTVCIGSTVLLQLGDSFREHRVNARLSLGQAIKYLTES